MIAHLASNGVMPSRWNNLRLYKLTGSKDLSAECMLQRRLCHAAVAALLVTAHSCVCSCDNERKSGASTVVQGRIRAKGKAVIKIQSAKFIFRRCLKKELLAKCTRGISYRFAVKASSIGLCFNHGS
jgi:hypothetical protein